MTSKKLLFLIFQNLVFSKDHKRGGWLPEAEAPATSLSSSRSSGAAEDGPTSSASSGSLTAPTSTQRGLQGFGSAFIFCGSGSSRSSQSGSEYGSSFLKN